MKEVMRMAMELCKKDLEELIREFGEERAVEILKNNIKILEMKRAILNLKKKEKEKRIRRN